MLAPVAGARPSMRGAVEQSPHSFRIGVNISQKCFLLFIRKLITVAALSWLKNGFFSIIFIFRFFEFFWFLFLIFFLINVAPQFQLEK